jgi:hypothetical protein
MIYVTRIIYILLLFFSISFYPKVTKPFKWLCYFIWITILNESIAFTLNQLGQKNTFGSPFYNTVGLFLWYLIYNNSLARTASWKWMRFFYVLVFIFFIINSLFWQKLNMLPTYSLNLKALLLIASSLLLFLHMLNEPDKRSIFEQSTFWMNSAVLVYHATTFVTFTITNYLYLNNYPTMIHGHINLVMCWIYYPILGLSLWLNAKEVKHARSN